jgi:hypothetical protein
VPLTANTPKLLKQRAGQRPAYWNASKRFKSQKTTPSHLNFTKFAYGIYAYLQKYAGVFQWG